MRSLHPFYADHPAIMGGRMQQHACRVHGLSSQIKLSVTLLTTQNKAGHIFILAGPGVSIFILRVLYALDILLLDENGHVSC